MPELPSIYKERKWNAFRVGAIHVSARAAGKIAGIRTLNTLERDGGIECFLRSVRPKRDFAVFFLRAVHAAQSDMFADQRPEILNPGWRAFREDAAQLPFGEISGSARNLQ